MAHDATLWWNATVYEMYCLTDPVFFDAPSSGRGESTFARPAPVDWQLIETGEWLVYRRDNAELRRQGWKIHSSACLDNADRIVDAVWDYCVPRGITFKILRSRGVLLLRNSKSADRSSSGKFVTIYPTDDDQFESTLNELGVILREQAGPSILSDLRWDDGPLHTRYGGFAERYCLGAGGDLELAIEDDSGTLVPDERGVAFHLPGWIALPEFLAPHLAARNRSTVDDLPYRIEGALHFSNGGGVYRGSDRGTGAPVVLKEARPHAGLTLDGADAVERLDRERRVLQRLDGVAAVPQLRDYFTRGDHHFLVQDFIDGDSLNRRIVQSYPLMVDRPDDGAIAEYTEWAIDICRRVEQAVEEVHRCGIVISDLHPSNVLVNADGEIALIDWEVAGLESEELPRVLGRPGFVAPAGRSGFDVDRYALACLRLYVFLPVTTLVGLDPAKAEHIATEIEELFPVPHEFLAEAVEVIASRAVSRAPRFRPDPTQWPQLRDSMVEAILASATPDREDRLFPGGIQQFSPGGGINLAYGASGVLLALHAVGAGRHPEHEEWLVRQATRRSANTPLGLYDGLHGVAYALDRLGRSEDARRVLEICIDPDAARRPVGMDLSSGLSGIALSLAHFAGATDDATLWGLTWAAVDKVADDIRRPDRPRAGLMRGATGAALLLVRLYEVTGDGGLLDAAAAALRQDLQRCVWDDSGALHVDEGWRTMPYLAEGSGGIGLVLRDYLAYRDDEQFTAAAKGIRKAAAACFYVEPGLFRGRAGMLLAVRHGLPAAAPVDDPDVIAHVRRLAWHALDYHGHLAFPGEALLRLSMDLATGSAGVLLALGAALHDYRVHLPFLGPLPRVADADTAHG